jgi:hypothetical protein
VFFCTKESDTTDCRISGTRTTIAGNILQRHGLEIEDDLTRIEIVYKPNMQISLKEILQHLPEQSHHSVGMVLYNGRDGDGETFLKSTLDFLVLDDIESLFSRDATFGERLLAAMTFIPGGKLVNIAGKGIKSAVKVKNVSDKLEDLPRPHTNPSRNASLREIKRELEIPMSQQPVSQRMVPLTDSNGNRILNANKQPVMTRELTYEVNGKKVVIQDHSAGHDFGQGGIGN